MVSDETLDPYDNLGDVSTLVLSLLINKFGNTSEVPTRSLLSPFTPIFTKSVKLNHHFLGKDECYFRIRLVSMYYVYLHLERHNFTILGPRWANRVGRRYKECRGIHEG